MADTQVRIKRPCELLSTQYCRDCDFRQISSCCSTARLSPSQAAIRGTSWQGCRDSGSRTSWLFVSRRGVTCIRCHACGAGSARPARAPRTPSTTSRRPATTRRDADAGSNAPPPARRAGRGTARQRRDPAAGLRAAPAAAGFHDQTDAGAARAHADLHARRRVRSACSTTRASRRPTSPTPPTSSTAPIAAAGP